MAIGMFNFQSRLNNDKELEVTDGETVGTLFDPSSVNIGTIPSDLLINEEDQAKWFQAFIDFFRESQQEADGRLERQTQAAEWLRVLTDYATGKAELEDLKAVDVSDLAEMPGWSEYYSGVIGEETDTGETDGTEEQDPNLKELIEKYGQEAVDDAQRKLKELEAVLGQAIEDPWGTLEGIINKTKSASSGSICSATGGPAGTGLPEWVRECVTVGVGLELPFPLPGPLGSIFKGATVGDIEDAIKKAGHDIGKVLSGETSIEEVMGGLGDWVSERVGEIFEGASEVSVGSILGTIGDILVGGGYILAGSLYDEYFKDKVNTTIGVPIIPFDSVKECQDSERYTADAEGNCGECIDPEKTYDANQGKCVETGDDDDDDDDLGDTTSEFGTCPDGVTAKINKEGSNCTGVEIELCDDNSEPDENGRCPEDFCKDGTLKATQPFGICPEDQETTTDTEYTEPTVDCTKPKVGFAPSFDPTASAKYASYSAKYDSECAEGEGPDDTETGNGTGITFTVVCGQKEPYVPTGNALAYSQAYSEYEAEYNEKCGTDGNGGNGGETIDECPPGTVVTADNYQACGKVDCFTNGTPGPYVDSFSECPSEGVIKDPEDTTVTYECDDPYAATNPDGSCGACKEGYVFDGGVERCVQENVVTENCQDAAYAAANPEECGSGTTPVTETPDDSSTTSGGGGGGGGGGGRRGMFSTFDYQRTPFVGVQYQSPIRPVRALNVLDSFLQNELRNKNNLFS